jgi:hypothetical protein
MRQFFCALALTLVASNVFAGPFGLFTKKRSTSNQNSGGTVYLGTAQAVANHMASIGRIGHFGGNPYAYEGVGMGSTPHQAEMNCCYRQRMIPRDVGIAQGSNGMYYACCRY